MEAIPPRQLFMKKKAPGHVCCVWCNCGGTTTQVRDRQKGGTDTCMGGGCGHTAHTGWETCWWERTHWGVGESGDFRS